MSAVFILSAGKASHMKPRNRIDLIKENPRNNLEGTPRQLDTSPAKSKVKQAQKQLEQKIGLSA